jgi:hypothetical protein
MNFLILISFEFKNFYHKSNFKNTIINKTFPENIFSHTSEHNEYE